MKINNGQFKRYICKDLYLTPWYMIRAGYQSKIKANEWIALELKATKTEMIKSNAKVLKQNKNIYTRNDSDKDEDSTCSAFTVFSIPRFYVFKLTKTCNFSKLIR